MLLLLLSFCLLLEETFLFFLIFNTEIMLKFWNDLCIIYQNCDAAKESVSGFFFLVKEISLLGQKPPRQASASGFSVLNLKHFWFVLLILLFLSSAISGDYCVNALFSDRNNFACNQLVKESYMKIRTVHSRTSMSFAAVAYAQFVCVCVSS